MCGFTFSQMQSVGSVFANRLVGVVTATVWFSNCIQCSSLEILSKQQNHCEHSKGSKINYNSQFMCVTKTWHRLWITWIVCVCVCVYQRCRVTSNECVPFVLSVLMCFEHLSFACNFLTSSPNRIPRNNNCVPMNEHVSKELPSYWLSVRCSSFGDLLNFTWTPVRMRMAHPFTPFLQWTVEKQRKAWENPLIFHNFDAQ